MLTEPLAGGATTLTVGSSADFHQGDLAWVHQRVEGLLVRQASAPVTAILDATHIEIAAPMIGVQAPPLPAGAAVADCFMGGAGGSGCCALALAPHGDPYGDYRCCAGFVCGGVQPCACGEPGCREQFGNNESFSFGSCRAHAPLPGDLIRIPFLVPGLLQSPRADLDETEQSRTSAFIARTTCLLRAAMEQDGALAPFLPRVQAPTGQAARDGEEVSPEDAVLRVCLGMEHLRNEHGLPVEDRHGHSLWSGRGEVTAFFLEKSRGHDPNNPEWHHRLPTETERSSITRALVLALTTQ